MTSPASSPGALGLESRIVRIVDYQAAWPELFRLEAERIAAVLSPPGLMLEHVGSTAVPGLPAKPVLDILGGYHPPLDLRALVSALGELGYLYRGEQGIPDRHFFRRGEPRAYHLHVAPVASAFWHDHRDFRDLLLAEPATRDAYGALKRELAARFPRDRESYIAAKGPFVQEALRRRRSSPQAGPG